MSFGEKGIEPADGFTGDGFIVRPLVPSDVVLDHEAVMSSREFLYHWEQDPPYPPEDFSVEDNLEDLQQMDSEHRNKSRYTYTVMNADKCNLVPRRGNGHNGSSKPSELLRWRYIHV